MTRVFLHIVVYLLHLLCCIAASAVEAKLKADDKGAARANAAELVRLLAGDELITIRGGNFYVERIDTPARVGQPAVSGVCGRAYELLLVEPDLCGTVTRLISVKGDAVLRNRGTGNVWENIEFRGHESRPASLVEVEGRATPATGRHVFRNCSFIEGGVGIRALGGFYDINGTFVSDENHADNCSVENALFMGVDVCFKSENQQAVFWRFAGVDVNCHHEERPTIIFDLVKGGHLRASGIACNHPWITLFRVWGGAGMSPWTNRLVAEEVWWDRPHPTLHKNPTFTVFEYVKPDDLNRSWERWQVRASGQLNIERERLNRAALLKVPPWYDRSGLRIDIGGVN